MKSLIERVNDVRPLWTMVIVGVPVPSDDKLAWWCGQYSETDLEHGIMRASCRLHKGGLLPVTSECERYVAGVMSHERQKVKDKLARVLARQKEKVTC